jgi:hypothetical protein
MDWAKEWDFVAHAPWLTVGTVVTITGVVWAIFYWAYQRRIANFESELRLKNAQLDDYSEKLRGATPEEAKARIDSLEAKVHKLIKDVIPWKLTDDQQREIVKAAREAYGQRTISIVYSDKSTDGKELAGKLDEAYKAAGWSTLVAPAASLGSPTESGLTVMVGNEIALSPAESAIVEGFRHADLEFEIKQGLPGAANLMGTQVMVLINNVNQEKVILTPTQYLGPTVY